MLSSFSEKSVAFQVKPAENIFASHDNQSLEERRRLQAAEPQEKMVAETEGERDGGTKLDPSVL